MTRIGRYEVVAEAHVGRLTAVYRGRHRFSRAACALKTASPRATEVGRAEAERTLRREAEVRAAVEHPALLALHDMMIRGGAATLVGPWLAGGTLYARWRERPPVAAAVGLAEQVGAGLDALHARGWVHGDLSPNNVVFDAEGRPRITDFGSCVPAGAPTPERWGVTRLTGAPESWTAATVDGRADVYALAVIVFFALVGRWPFEAPGTAALIGMHAKEPPPRPTELHPLLPRAIDEVLLRALAKRPEERFASGSELAEAVRTAIAAPARRGFVPVAEVKEEGAGSRARAAVDRFVAGLADAERAAFMSAMAALRRREAAARASVGGALRTMAAPLAALRAAEDLGVLAALADGARTTEALAAELELPADGLARLCRFLAADGRVSRSAEGWTLRPPLAAAYTFAARSGATGRPVGDTQARWGRLARWLRTGTPDIEMDGDEDGHGYAGSVGDLGDNSEAQAGELAAALRRGGWLGDGAAILDVGAGSAVWSLAMAARCGGTVTALDRPKVLAVARARADAQGLGERFAGVAGSWQTFEPQAGTYAAIVLAKVCHLESPAGLCALLRRLRPGLRADGRVIVVDTIPEDLEEASIDALRYDLSLALRTLRGRIHDRGGYGRALAAADLRVCAGWPVSRGGAGLDVLVAAPADDR